MEHRQLYGNGTGNQYTLACMTDKEKNCGGEGLGYDHKFDALSVDQGIVFLT